MQCNVLPHITASVFINDDGSGLHHDYEVWLERVCSRLYPAPHAPIDQAGPEAADPRTGGHNRTGEDACPERRDRAADAHPKRQVMGREIMVAVTHGWLDDSTEGFGRAQPRTLPKSLAPGSGSPAGNSMEGVEAGVGQSHLT